MAITVSAVRPRRTALPLERPLLSGVVGPVLLITLRRLALRSDKLQMRLVTQPLRLSEEERPDFRE
jgi:hypothetical protein